MSALVKVISMANGGATPHDGRWVVSWNPHTEFGVCEIRTTRDRSKARRFKDVAEAMAEWNTQSSVDSLRWSDGKPNKPLTGLVIEIENEDGGFPT